MRNPKNFIHVDLALLRAVTGEQSAHPDQQKKLCGAPYRLRGSSDYKCMRLIMGCQGKAFWDYTKLSMGYSMGGLKVGKGRDQGGLGRNQYGWIRG